MGFFFDSPEEKYSIERHAISEVEVKNFISRFRAPDLSTGQEHLIEDAILAKRHEHDGKLSLRDVFTILHHNKLEHKISENDLHEVMTQFEQHLGKV